MTVNDFEVIEHEPYVVEPAFAICSECGGQIRIRFWGEGIDSEIWCTEEDCDQKNIFR